MPTDYAKFFDTQDRSVGYWATIPLTEFSRSLTRIMEAHGVRRSHLATKLGLSRAYVTKVLSGQENITVATMAKFAMAIGAVVRVHVAERDAAVRWYESHDGIDKVVTLDVGTDSVRPNMSFSIEAGQNSQVVAGSIS